MSTTDRNKMCKHKFAKIEEKLFKDSKAEYSSFYDLSS